MKFTQAVVQKRIVQINEILPLLAGMAARSWLTNKAVNAVGGGNNAAQPQQAAPQQPTAPGATPAPAPAAPAGMPAQPAGQAQQQLPPNIVQAIGQNPVLKQYFGV